MSSPTFTAVKVKYLQFVEFLQLVNTTMGFNPIESRALNPDAEKILTYIMTLYNAQTKAIIHSNKRPSQELDFILNSIKFNTYKNTSLASALGQISHIENCDLKTTTIWLIMPMLLQILNLISQWDSKNWKEFIQELTLI